MNDMRTVVLVAVGLALFLPGTVVLLMSGGRWGLAAVGGIFVLGGLLIVWSDVG
ncbi:MAG: hypothetical protein ACOCQ7_01285 [Natronomonas sp.]